MEMESKIKDENYFQISGWMINKLGLKGNTLMVYAIIYGFSQDGESYFGGSRKYLCDFIGATKPTIDKSLQELIEKNYIFKYSEKINDITHNKYKINMDVVNFTSGKEILLGSKEIAPNNKIDNIDINNTNNISNKKEIEKEKIEKIYNYYLDKAIHYEYAKTKKNDFNDIPEKQIKAIKKTLDNTDDIESIFKTIDRYFEVITNKNYFFDTFWNVEKFFGQGNAFVDFTIEGSKWINYEIWKKKNGNPYSNKEISRETSYEEHKDKNYL